MTRLSVLVALMPLLMAQTCVKHVQWARYYNASFEGVQIDTANTFYPDQNVHLDCPTAPTHVSLWITFPAGSVPAWLNGDANEASAPMWMTVTDNGGTRDVLGAFVAGRQSFTDGRVTDDYFLAGNFQSGGQSIVFAPMVPFTLGTYLIVAGTPSCVNVWNDVPLIPHRCPGGHDCTQRQQFMPKDEHDQLDSCQWLPQCTTVGMGADGCPDGTYPMLTDNACCTCPPLGG